MRDFRSSEKDLADQLFGESPWGEKEFLSFLRKAEVERYDWRPKAKQISVSRYVLKLDGQIRGYGILRFPIPEDAHPPLGNLEFYVPPSSRGQGFATLTLNRLLFEAVRAGLARALVVAPSNQPAALRAIEHNRGERLKNQDSDEYVSFWISFRSRP